MPVRSTSRLCAVLGRFLHRRVWFWISEVPSWSRRGARAKRGRGGTKDAKLPYRRPRSAPHLMRCVSRISKRSAPIGAIVETTPAARTRPPLLLQEGTSPPRKFHLSDYFGQHCLTRRGKQMTIDQFRKTNDRWSIVINRKVKAGAAPEVCRSCS